MNILLVYPNLYGMNMLPPAIGLFTAILKNQGHSVELFDTTIYENLTSIDSDKQKSENLNARPFDDAMLKAYSRATDAIEDFRRQVDQFGPDLIAVSATEDMYPIGIRLLQGLDNKNRPMVVMGGVFPTFAPHLALEYSGGYVDYILKGEGEESLIDFINGIRGIGRLKDVPGLYGYVNNELINNALPSPVDMTTLPLPDYSLFEESRFYRPMQGKLRRMLPIQTIRGCPYRCGYCNSPSQMDIHKDENHKFFRKQKVDFIKAEIEKCLHTYKADSFYFWADTFLAWSDSEFNEFCDMYAEFKLPFRIQTRPETVQREKFERLKEVGLLRVAFGVEHGNDSFRKKILDRSVSNDKMIANLKIVTDLGIPISVNNIMGFPTETRDLVFDTIELNRQFQSDGINAYSYVPFHGTPLRSMSERLGYVEPGVLARSIMAPTMLSMPNFPKEQIEGIRRCFVLYTKMPKSYWPKIREAEYLTDAGDRAHAELRKECFDNFMNYGDHAIEEEVEKIDFEKDENKPGKKIVKKTIEIKVDIERSSIK